MKIQIIGPGVVGKATGEGFKRYGHEVWYVDESDTPTEAYFHFICTPESEVYKAVDKLFKNTIAGLLVIRSTVTPEMWKEISLKYPHTCHNPEFLRERVAEFEFLNADRVIIGQCCERHGDRLEELYKPFNVTIIRTNPLISIMTKLVTNAYLSTSISFWNEISMVCDNLKINSHELGSIASMDERIPAYGAKQHGFAFEGACLPKDLDHLVSEKTILLKAVKEVNEMMRRG